MALALPVPEGSELVLKILRSYLIRKVGLEAASELKCWHDDGDPVVQIQAWRLFRFVAEDKADSADYIDFGTKADNGRWPWG